MSLTRRQVTERSEVASGDVIEAVVEAVAEAVVEDFVILAVMASNFASLRNFCVGDSLISVLNL